MNIHSHFGDERSGCTVARSISGTSEIAEERRRQITAAAAVCFARRGFHGATMPEICAEAGLSPGTVYRYFRSKDELIEALVEQDRTESLELIAAMAATPDIVAAISIAVDEALAAVADPADAAVYLEVGAEAARNPRVGAIVRRHDESVIAALGSLLRRAQERGEIRELLDPRLAAEMINALIDGVISRKAIAPDADIASYAPLVKQMICDLLHPESAPNRSNGR